MKPVFKATYIKYFVLNITRKKTAPFSYCVKLKTLNIEENQENKYTQEKSRQGRKCKRKWQTISIKFQISTTSVGWCVQFVCIHPCAIKNVFYITWRETCLHEWLMNLKNKYWKKWACIKIHVLAITLTN